MFTAALEWPLYLMPTYGRLLAAGIKLLVRSSCTNVGAVCTRMPTSPCKYRTAPGTPRHRVRSSRSSKPALRMCSLSQEGDFGFVHRTGKGPQRTTVGVHANSSRSDHSRRKDHQSFTLQPGAAHNSRGHVLCNALSLRPE